MFWIIDCIVSSVLLYLGFYCDMPWAQTIIYFIIWMCLVPATFMVNVMFIPVDTKSPIPQPFRTIYIVVFTLALAASGSWMTAMANAVCYNLELKREDI